MFRVNKTEVKGGYLVAERILRVGLLLSLLANVTSGYLILHEYRRLGIVLDRSVPISMPAVGTMRQEVGIQLIASLISSTILVFCTVGVLWLRRRFLSSQESLRQVKMLAHDILASMDRGVVTTDCEGVIISINSAAIRLLDVDFECVGQPLTILAPPGMPLVEVYREVVGNQGMINDRDLNIERANHLLRLRVDGHVLKDPKGTSLGCVIHLRDVTERTFIEERMRRMERFLSLATLASGLHHEIKNPLTALSIHIQLLEESLSNRRAEEAVDELVGVLKTEVCRLNGVLESFRSFANLQNLVTQPTNTVEVVENAIRLIRPQAAEQHVQITLLLPDKELPLVPLDAVKFEQAFLNLVINALEAMPKGGNLTVSMTASDGEFRLSVQDSGVGIPPEIQPNLFQPYFSTKSKGSGMGLALSEKLIGQHGGRIAYRTGPEGTTFDIIIPLEQPNNST